MKKNLIISAILIIISASQTHSLVTIKVYPDYTITAYIITTNKGWKVNIKIRDMTLKEYIKAWSETTTEPEDIDLAGNRSLSSFSHEYSDMSQIVGVSGGTYNYIKAYKAITYSVFMIAKKIQDAGFIPIVKYGSIDQISTDGAMSHAKDYQPTGNYRKAISVIKYVPDYYIHTRISPIMSEDGLSVDHWKTTFEVTEYGEGRGIAIWKGDETNILKFDLSTPPEYTKSEFTIISDSWLDAQKEMFVKTHLLITKMLYKNNSLLIEARYGSIEFVNSAGVTLIDLRNGIPDGTMEPYIATTPESPTILTPTNGSNTNSSQVEISWTTAANAVSYRVELGTTGQPLQTILTENTSVTVNVMKSSTIRTYTLMVHAISEDDIETGSNYVWFTTKESAYKYIRILSTSKSWNERYDMMFTEMNFYETKAYGGTEFAYSGTATASSEQSGFEASKANDGSYGTMWIASNHDTPQWIKIQQSASTPKVLGSFKIYVHCDSSDGCAIGKSFVVEGSNTSDFSESVVIGTFTTNNYTSQTWMNFVIP